MKSLPQTRNKKSLLIVCIIFAIGFFILSHSNILHADDTPITSQIPELEEQIESTVFPENPGPGDTVTITLDAYGTDLNNATISWLLNGKRALSGKGEKKLTFTAGALGQNTAIIAIIVPVDGKQVTKSFNISPQNIDILWEARTYTPPFYKGKALITPEEKVVFLAMPAIVDRSKSFVDPSSITYTWSKDQEIDGDKSGRGMNSFSYTGDILMHPVETSIAAKAPDGTEAKNTITLGTIYPATSFYEVSPLYGILFNKEVSGQFTIGSKDESTIAAFPYYMGVATRFDPDISYTWAMNYKTIDVPTTQNNMTFRNTDKKQGKSNVSVSVENKQNFLEQSDTNTIIDFTVPKPAFSF